MNLMVRKMSDKKYLASISYGKDSLAMLEVIKQHNLPLDRIVHLEIMATPTIFADLPPLTEFKKKADKIIFARYGLNVEHIRSKISFEEYFYQRIEKGKWAGKIHGFPTRFCPWCNSQLKISQLRKLQKNYFTYIGIAADEIDRQHNFNENVGSPLFDHGITEAEARKICEN